MKKMMTLMLVMLLALGMAACGGNAEPAKETIDLNAVYEECAAIMPEMMILDENTMLNFLGIKAEDCSQAIAVISAGGLNADELWLIEAKGQDAYDRLINLVNVRLTAKEEETINYTPDQYVIVEKAEILTKDLYIAFLVSPDVEQLKTIVETAFH